ncbi:MAG: excinuclease ABC subunit C, partial [Parcubacteria group bacterium LiPW_39]
GLCPTHKNPPQSPFYKGGSNVGSPLLKRGVGAKSPEGASPLFGGDFIKQRVSYFNSLNALKQFLRLYAGEPIRIEAYDISNIHGVWATGSMIVFYGDKAQKSDYRRFKIKTVAGANDVAMIKEVLCRRFGHPEWPYPDLILIDGGKAQLAAGNLEIKKLGNFIPAVALAKREEKIYTEYGGKSLKLSALPSSLGLIFQAIRNEAHRFAIFYYRHLHEKTLKLKRKK